MNFMLHSDSFESSVILCKGCHLFKQFERFLGLFLIEDSDGISGMDQNIVAHLCFGCQGKLIFRLTPPMTTIASDPSISSI